MNGQGRECRSEQRGPRVAVVILNHNGKRLAERCLQSVFASTYPHKDVILVDNASTDDSVAYLHTRFPDLHSVRNTENLGVTGGRNQGFREAIQRGTDYVLSLDNDAYIDAHFIHAILQVAQCEARIGVLGPKAYDADAPHLIQCAGGRITYTQNVCTQRGMGEVDRGQYDTIQDVDYFPGFGFMARRDVLEQLDFLDEHFYGYGHEDTDFCLRARQLGYRVVYVPEARMWHQGSATIGSYSPRKKYLEAVNSVYFVRKYGRPRDRMKYACIASAGLLYAFIQQSMRGNAKAVWAKARGMCDGLRKPIKHA